MLARIDPIDLAKGRYTWHHRDTDEPDDGVIVKLSSDVSDPSIAKHGLPPDNKVYIQVRRRTRRLFKAAGVYDDAYCDFFDVTEEIHERLARRWRTFPECLREVRPDLPAQTHDCERSVLRLMRYNRARPDDGGLSGKVHTDKNDMSVHVWDSRPGLVLRPAGGGDIDVPTRVGEGLMFSGDGWERLTGVPTLVHAAKHDATATEARRVIVYFSYFAPVTS